MRFCDVPDCSRKHTYSTVEVAELVGASPEALRVAVRSFGDVWGVPGHGVQGAGTRRQWPESLVPSLRVWALLTDGQGDGAEPRRRDMRRHAVAAAVASPEAEWIVARADGAVACGSLLEALDEAKRHLSCFLIRVALLHPKAVKA